MASIPPDEAAKNGHRNDPTVGRVNSGSFGPCPSSVLKEQGRWQCLYLGQPDALHPMQAAFVKHDGYQCGYCTPGQICASVAMLDEFKAGIPSHVTADLTAAPQVTAEEIRERLSGNICRCGAYSNIVDAITEVAGRQA